MTVVVPVFGCAGCLQALHRRLRATVAAVTDAFELVFVDDRSYDGAWATLVELAHSDPSVRAFRLSRNFGQDAAITAGLAKARGGWVVVLDCDLQEAPEDIPRLYAQAQEGFDIVQTIRRDRRQSRLRHLASRIYRKLVFEDERAGGLSTLSLISRPVVDAFMSLGDRDREYRLALQWLGFSRTLVEIDFHERLEGKSSYTIRHLISLAATGVFFRTTRLLTWIVYGGFVIAFGGTALAIFMIIDHFAHFTEQLPGYTSLAVLMLLLFGCLMVTVGVVGMYVGRMFEQVKGRPLYIIDAEASSEEEGPIRRATTQSEGASPRAHTTTD
ncbi:MAG: glycosyltransferase [Actinobacteria bacterium]|nr:glycosyltransferase [Actinomycetota bacterium]